MSGGTRERLGLHIVTRIINNYSYMIQRIQTLYLLIAAALMTVAVFSPLAVFNVGAAEYTLSSFSLAGEGGSFATLWLGILLAVSALLPLATLFLYKRRQLQIRLCAVELVLLIGCIVFIGIYYWLSNRIPPLRLRCVDAAAVAGARMAGHASHIPRRSARALARSYKIAGERVRFLPLRTVGYGCIGQSAGLIILGMGRAVRQRPIIFWAEIFVCFEINVVYLYLPKIRKLLE